MILVRAYLAPSAIEGLGCYTAIPIRDGETVWRFDLRIDQLIPRAWVGSLDAAARAFLERYGYDVPDQPDMIALDADESRFMNHSETPNLDFSSGHEGIALRDIAADEELTCDYRTFTLGELVFLPPLHRVGPALQGGRA